MTTARIKQTFLTGLRYVQANHKHGWMVDELPSYDKYDIGIVSGGMAGFAVSPDKELVSVWSMGHGFMPRIINAAIYMNAEWLTCYDAGLVEQYERGGFHVERRSPFDPLLAPANIPAGLAPDFIVMRR